MKKTKIIALLYTIFLSNFAFAQIVDIPDTNFKAKLLEADATNTIAKNLAGDFFKIDANNDGEIQQVEALQVSYLDVKSDSFDQTLQIADMQGVFEFTELNYLDCSRNRFTTLDLSSNINLVYLNCSENYFLNSINVLNNSSLETLLISSTTLTSLDLSNNVNLKVLNSSNSNQFSGVLDLTNNINLEDLNCYGMNLTTLDLSNNINLLMLNCLSNVLTTLDLSNNPNLINVTAVANQLSSINLSGNTSLEALDLYGNELTSLDLSANTNLQSLRCSSNQLTSLNLSNNINLITVDCTFNQLTSLNIDNCINLTELSCSSNQISSVNLSDNMSLNSVNISFNQISSLNVDNNTNLETLWCNSNLISSLNVDNNTVLIELQSNNNLLTSLNLSNNVNLEILDLNNNQFNNIDVSNNLNLNNFGIANNFLSEIDVSNNLNLSNLNVSGNQLLVINVSELINLSFLSCSNNLISELDLSNNPISWVSCSDNNNLTILNIKNNVISDGEFNADNLPNLQYVCVDDSELAFVTNYFNSNGITANINSYCSFTPGGDYNTITGNITFDSQNDGCDINDDEFPYIKINIDDGVETGSTFTTNNGEYDFYTQEGTFTVTPDLENSNFFNIGPADATINFPDTNNNIEVQNFCITPNGIHPDVEVALASTIPARPGFDAEYLITYRNKGNQTLSGGITLSYNAEVLDFVSSSETPASQVGALVNWTYLDLLPFESRSIYVTLNVNSPMESPAVNIDDILGFTVEAEPIAGDEFPSDNTFNFDQTVVGSFDPNDITCIEGDIVEPSEIGNYLHYLIRFENTGNAAAENVVVKTEVDPAQFDINTLRLLSTSHNADVRVTNNTIEFIFEDINLNASGGHGNILLRMRTKQNLDANDTVTKNAEIYFDYNFPIETNDANTTFTTLSVSDYEVDNSVSLYPNPVKNSLNIKAKNMIKSVSLFDTQGRLLQTKIHSNNQIKIDLSSREKGIYFIKIITDTGVKVEKIVKN